MVGKGLTLYHIKILSPKSVWRIDKKSLQNKQNVCSTQTEKYLWTFGLSPWLYNMYIYTGDRYAEGQGNNRCFS